GPGAVVTAMKFGPIPRFEVENKCAVLLLPLASYLIITSCVSEWNDLRLIVRAFVYGVVFENLFAVGGFLAAYFFGVSNPFTQYGGLRLSGTLLDPNA